MTKIDDRGVRKYVFHGDALPQVVRFRWPKSQPVEVFNRYWANATNVYCWPEMKDTERSECFQTEQELIEAGFVLEQGSESGGSLR